MNRKPWPFIILALIFLLMPISNIVATYFVSEPDLSFSEYLYYLFTLPSKRSAVIRLILPAIAAAYATYAVKSWSYIVLGIYTIFITATGLFYGMNYSHEFDLIQLFLAVIIPIIFSALVTIYFLVPSVKSTYFDERIRWWESKPRYITDIKASISVDGQQESHDGKITNISEGGVFLELEKSLTMAQKLKIDFESQKTQFALEAKIVFHRNDINGYGLQFEDLSGDQKKKLKVLIKTLKTEGASRTRPIPLWSNDLKKWFFNVLKTGKGLTPKIPEKYKLD